MNTTNKIFAIPTLSPASPPNPKIAATIARTKKIRDQFNNPPSMTSPYRGVRVIPDQRVAGIKKQKQ
jgi:hypothetical protein